MTKILLKPIKLPKYSRSQKMTKIPHKPKYDQNTPKTEKNIYKDRNTPKPLKKEKEKPHSSLNVF